MYIIKITQIYIYTLEITKIDNDKNWMVKYSMTSIVSAKYFL